MNDVEFLGVAMIALVVLVVLVVIGYIFEDIKIKSTERRERIIKNHLLSLIIINNIKFHYIEGEEYYRVSSNNKDLGGLYVEWYSHFIVNDELAVTKKQRHILNELKKNQQLLGDLVYCGETKNVFLKPLTNIY